MSGRVTQLGCSALTVGRIAFGCEQLGGYQWGDVDPGEVQEAIELALDRGINLFDTADCYGRGESERRLGRILGPRRDRARIATKFGVRFTDSGAVYYDASAEWARHALEASLERLGTDHVDLLQLHYWDGRSSLTALFDCLERLREQGKIRAYGTTNCYPDPSAAAYPGLVSVSMEYSLVCRKHEAEARKLGSAGLTFIAYGSLGQGVLSGKYTEPRFGSDDRRSRPAYRNFHGEQFARNTRILEVIRTHARAAGVTPSQIALAWILTMIPDSIALVGIKRPAQLEDAVSALSLHLEPDTLAALDEVSRASLSE